MAVKTPWDDNSSGPVGGISNTINSASKGDISGTAYNYGRTALDPSGAYGSVQTQAGKAFGQDHSKQDALNAESNQVSQDSLNRQRGILNGMTQSDQAYQGAYSKAAGEYGGDVHNYKTDYLANLDKIGAEAAAQGKSAEATYSNDIQPRLKSAMEDAQKQSNSAMSLADAGDPNNAVHKAVEAKYNDLAGGVQKQGLADYGVLSALGSQATANTMGGAAGPMTGAQLGTISANNSRNATTAYTVAAQRMNNLKQQGIDQGFTQSDAQYNRGQAAKDRYTSSIGNYQSGMDQDIARQQNFRDLDLGYASDRMGTKNSIAQSDYDAKMGVVNSQHNLDTAGANREIGYENTATGNTQAGIANQISQAHAQNAQQGAILGGVLQAGATGVGGYYGGAQGAQAGAMGSRGIAQGMSGYQVPPQQQQQQYGYV